MRVQNASGIIIRMQYLLRCSVILVIEGERQGKKMQESWSWHYHEN